MPKIQIWHNEVSTLYIWEIDLKWGHALSVILHHNQSGKYSMKCVCQNRPLTFIVILIEYSQTQVYFGRTMPIAALLFRHIKASSFVHQIQSKEYSCSKDHRRLLKVSKIGRIFVERSHGSVHNEDKAITLSNVSNYPTNVWVKNNYYHLAFKLSPRGIVL